MPVRRRALLAVAATAALVSTALIVLSPTAAPAATVTRVLFDNTKAETAGNADWIISTSQPDPLAQNSNPTGDTSWTGALSSWGVALQRAGSYSLKTLPTGNTITYGGSGALDLKNFDVFVLPEPNVKFSTAEKTAIMKFVQAGGGLFLIVDHSGSDRNNDGYDSVEIANDLMTSNGVDNTDPFGFSIDTNDISTDNPRAISGTDPVLNGPFGKVTGSILRDGSTQTLHKADNAAVKGLLFKTGSTTSAFFTTSTFGSGRVAVWGDSSPVDDGTGQSGNTLYNGWTDPAGTDAALALNATAWLGGGGGGTTPTTPPTTPPTTTPPTGGACTYAQLLGNTGFESGATVWSASSGVITSDTGEAAHAGSWKAWLDGYGSAHTDTLTQTVTIPSGCSGATLSFWLKVDTDETSTTTAYDKLTVAAHGSTLATYSNLNASSGYVQRTLTVSGTGSTTLTFTGTEGSQVQTSFVIDDVTLSAA